jgi:hypothetical protein
MAVLNKQFSDTGFSFTLASTDYTVNDLWFGMTQVSLKRH